MKSILRDLTMIMLRILIIIWALVKWIPQLLGIGIFLLCMIFTVFEGDFDKFMCGVSLFLFFVPIIIQRILEFLLKLVGGDRYKRQQEEAAAREEYRRKERKYQEYKEQREMEERFRREFYNDFNYFNDEDDDDFDDFENYENYQEENNHNYTSQQAKEPELIFFKGCKSYEEAKTRYRSLSKVLHPDNGGDSEAYSTMKNEFESNFKKGA